MTEDKTKIYDRGDMAGVFLGGVLGGAVVLGVIFMGIRFVSETVATDLAQTRFINECIMMKGIPVVGRTNYNYTTLYCIDNITNLNPKNSQEP